MGDIISSTCFGPSWCLQLLKVEVAADLLPWGLCCMGSARHPTLVPAAAQGSQTPPAPLGDGEMVTLGHRQSAENAVCSLLLLHSNKRCGCTVFICHLVLGDEQGPGVSLEEPLWVFDGCSGGLGLPGHLPCPLGRGYPHGGQVASLPVGGLRCLADAQRLQTIWGQLNNQFPPHFLCTVKHEKKVWV